MSNTIYSRQILIKLEFSPDGLSKNTQLSNFMKIRLVEAELFHADGANSCFFAILRKRLKRLDHYKLGHSLMAPPG